MTLNLPNIARFYIYRLDTHATANRLPCASNCIWTHNASWVYQ